MKTYEDKVQLGVDGWKERYYMDKFKVKPGELKSFLYSFVRIALNFAL